MRHYVLKSFLFFDVTNSDGTSYSAFLENFKTCDAGILKSIVVCRVERSKYKLLLEPNEKEYEKKNE